MLSAVAFESARPGSTAIVIGKGRLIKGLICFKLFPASSKIKISLPLFLAGEGT